MQYIVVNIDNTIADLALVGNTIPATLTDDFYAQHLGDLLFNVPPYPGAKDACPRKTVVKVVPLALTTTVAVVLTVPTLAITSVVPAATPVTSPPVTVAMPSFPVCQLQVDVTFWTVPSLMVAVAVN